MVARIANLLLLSACFAAVAGAAAFIVAAPPASWGELAEGVVWYGAHQWGTLSLWLVCASAAATGSVLALGVHHRSRFPLEQTRRVERALRQDRRAGSGRAGSGRVDRARRELERELLRARHRVDEIVDLLLGTLLDLGASELRLEPGAMVVGVTVVLDGKPAPMVSMSPPQYARVVGQLRLMLGGERHDRGELEVRSSARMDLLRVDLEEGPRGTTSRLVFVGPGGDSSARASGREADPLKPTRRSIVHRLERAPLRDAHTGELPQPFIGEDDSTDSEAGLITGFDPSAESEIGPVLALRERRPVMGLEAWLRWGTGLCLLALALAFSWRAYSWGLGRLLSGRGNAPWREVLLTIRSRPNQARVLVQGDLRGRTPLTLLEQCKGRRMDVVIQAQGYVAWQWSGICPAAGHLELRGDLQRLR
jgi:hypothetical protein